MGLPIPPLPPDYGIGDDCLACHAAGKTPNYVFIRFWDITPCDGMPNIPNGYTFICKQVPGQPCQYRGDLDFDGFTWTAYWDSDIPWGPERRAELALAGAPPIAAAAFFWRVDGCGQDFPDNFQACPGSFGTGGHAHVDIYVPPIIILLTSGYHFVTTDRVLYEIQEVGMDHKLVHLADRNGKTNILIYLDDEDVEYEV